jgi:hypothetical protein
MNTYSLKFVLYEVSYIVARFLLNSILVEKIIKLLTSTEHIGNSLTLSNTLDCVLLPHACPHFMGAKLNHSHVSLRRCLRAQYFSNLLKVEILATVLGDIGMKKGFF